MDTTFSKTLARYKDGTATEAECKYIENEIEKNRLLNDLLADELELDFHDDNRDEAAETEADAAFISKQNDLIKKSINKKLRKIISYSAVIVLVVLLSVNFLASPIVNSLYYKPKAITQGEYFSDIYFDMRTFTELSLPGYALNQAIAEPLGFGKYNIYITQNNLFTNRPENTSTKLIKGKRIGAYEDLFMRYYRYYNLFGSRREMEEETKGFLEHSNKRNLNDLKAIEKTAYTSAFLTYSRDLSLEEFGLLKSKYKEELEFKWVGIRISDESKINDKRLGFNPNLSDGSDASDSPSKELYPYLRLIDYIDDTIRVEEGQTYEGFVAQYYEEHFMSLLKYMIDRPEFTEMLYYTTTMTDYYEEVLNYVEENGASTYGSLVYGTAEDILEFIENENTTNLIIDDVKVSKYSK